MCARATHRQPLTVLLCLLAVQIYEYFNIPILNNCEHKFIEAGLDECLCHRVVTVLLLPADAVVIATQSYSSWLESHLHRIRAIKNDIEHFHTAIQCKRTSPSIGRFSTGRGYTLQEFQIANKFKL